MLLVRNFLGMGETFFLFVGSLVEVFNFLILPFLRPIRKVASEKKEGEKNG